MPDSNPISSLYPQPPPPGAAMPSILSNPIGAAAGIMQIQQLQGTRAAGNALISGFNPDGSYNPAAAVAAARSNPNIGFAGPQVTQGILAARGSDLTNSTTAADLGTNYNKTIAAIAASHAYDNNGSPNLDSARSAAAEAVRAGVPAPLAYGWLKTVNPNDVKGSLARSATYTMGAGAAAQPVEGTPTPAGAPTKQPLATTITGVATGNARPTALSPQAQGDITEYQKDQGTSTAIAGNLRSLTTALPLAMKLANTEFGPSSPEFTKVKATLASLGIINPDTSDGAVRQEVGKYLLRYATMARGAGRSDAGLSAALGSNPNPDTMMKPATLGLMINQIGMDRQDAALPMAAGGAPGYQDYRLKYYPTTDPRAFSFDLLSPAQQTELRASLGDKNSPAYKKFVNSYNIAKTTGWIIPPSTSQ